MAGWYGWKEGTTNCKEEQECDILERIFTKPVKEPFFYLKFRILLALTDKDTYWEEPKSAWKKCFLGLRFKFNKTEIVRDFYLGKVYIYPVRYEQFD